MSILDRLLGTYEETLHGDWKNMTQEDQIQEVLQSSYGKPVVIFKHSTRCGTSSMAKHTLETGWDFEKGDLDFYYLDLITYRQISNNIAQTFKVSHHSPQIIVIKDGLAVYDTSHHNISIGNLRNALKAIT